MKIRIFEALYLLLPVISLILIGCVLIPRVRKYALLWRSIGISIFIAGIFWSYTVYWIIGVTSRMASIEINLDWDSSKTDLIEYFGSSPTLVFDPATIGDGEILPDSAVWHYQVRVPPFKRGVRFEFYQGELNGRGHTNPRNF